MKQSKACSIRYISLFLKPHLSPCKEKCFSSLDDSNSVEAVAQLLKRLNVDNQRKRN